MHKATVTTTTKDIIAKIEHHRKKYKSQIQKVDSRIKLFSFFNKEIVFTMKLIKLWPHSYCRAFPFFSL